MNRIAREIESMMWALVLSALVMGALLGGFVAGVGR